VAGNTAAEAEARGVDLIAMAPMAARGFAIC
jgi:hypothetical protein